MMYFPSKLSPHTLRKKIKYYMNQKNCIFCLCFLKVSTCNYVFYDELFFVRIMIDSGCFNFYISPKIHIKLIKLDIYDRLKVYPKRRKFCEKIKIKSDV